MTAMSYEDFMRVWRNGDSAVECFTSGSTGTPKRILLPKSEMARSARRTIDFFGLTKDSRLHSCISPEFIGGKMMAVRAEILGCGFTWETPSNRPLRECGYDHISLLAVVPSQMIDLLDRLESGEQMPAIDHIIIGGSPINPALHRRMAASGLDAWETYGMTETASHIALRKAGNPDEWFRPLECIDVSLDSESRLVIDMEGWQRLLTNDIAEIDDLGCFRIIGRSDNAIITGGKKVHPEPLEALLEERLGYPVLLSGEPDEKWGEKVVMTIEDGYALEDSAILEICKKLLPKEGVPKLIRHDGIRHTKNGKKLRK